MVARWPSHRVRLGGDRPTDRVRYLQRTDNPANEFGPAWSPDGTRIAFASNRDGDLEIYVMDADGSSVIQLTNDPADDGSPDWMPR